MKNNSGGYFDINFPHYYGGKYYGFIKSRWLTIWFCDYRKNTVVNSCRYTIEVYSKLWGNKVIEIK